MATRKADFWYDIQHSLWLAWVFTLGLFNWGAFIHAGLRTGRKRWLLYGVLYALPVVAIFLLPSRPDGAPASTLDNVVYTTYFLSSMVSFIHAFMIRKEYILRLKAHDRASEGRLKDRIESEYGVDLDDEEPVAYVVKAVSGQVDLNRASEDELAALPGVGRMGAELAVDLRRRSGHFRSVEAFGDAIGLKDAQVEALRPLVTLGRTAPLASEQAESEAQRAPQRQRETEV